MTDGQVVLVTGAGGFIGGRIVEVLHARGTRVIAGVRRWSSAARVGRLDVEIRQCDVTNETLLSSALEGVSHVIHCAVGDAATTVNGTERLLQASERHGVARVVHVSTIDVYGQEAGEVQEDAPLQPTGAVYGDTKIEAERACRAALARGLPVSIIRPTIVYGPFSKLWTVEFALRLQQRPWPFPPALSSGICNAVYVDDVAQGALRALRRPEAVGEAFNINGGDWPTWYEYFSQLNAALGLPPIEAGSPGGSTLRARLVAPLRASAKFALRHLEPQIMQVYKRSTIARAAMKRVEGVIRAAPTSGEFRLYSRTATFPTTKAERLLGYTPSVTLSTGIDLSARWVRHSGYLPRA